ncbi:hypothetical protein ATG98_0620 [Marinobacter sp. LV10R520-4]|uniref:hypothetical protein n=1 Tax=Marinobacter sp. LV10R520-4 TaxID=1761796 RepID=UPI000BF274E2|nr:hypothetical protein [Marinobacter sp. LV10R520-4]PFG51665.1 hypothetical protein ATG98_0620 [Marinobacter sp. LV10R520-4]
MIPLTPVNDTVQLQRRLDSLAADFTRWRAQRPHQRAAVPQSLRDRAVALALASSRVCVSKALGVSYTMLSAWSPKLQAQATTRRRGTSHPSTSTGAAAPTFVPLEQTVADAALPTFTLSTSSGQRLTIEGACSPAQVSALVLALCATAGA